MNEWDRTDLNGNWQMLLIGNDEYSKSAEAIRTYGKVVSMDAVRISARVPGNFELDLQTAGMLPDPFFGSNVLLLQKYEGTHIFYARKFSYSRIEGKFPRLVFEGIDTVAEIFLNGEPAGKCDNMLVTQSYEVGGLLREGENELVVHIIPACIAARAGKISAGNTAMKYTYESLRLRKAPHMFGWDIMPRIVSGGIFRPVYIEYRPEESIVQAYLMTAAADAERGTALLELFYETDVKASDLSGYTISVTGECGNSHFSASSRLWFTSGKFSFTVNDARLWWPKGSGEPNLYDIRVELKRGRDIIDTYTSGFGIRTVRLERTATTDEFFSGKFQFRINGRRIFIMGTNWVPADAFHSRDRSRLPKMLDLLDDIGCNAIRCWGGNIYEDDFLYQHCDKAGILVWQDFAMACGSYPIDDEFVEAIEKEARSVVRRLRGHPCICLWSGDNECDVFMRAYGQDPGGNRITRKILPEVLEYEDPARPYIPSSPFIDKEAAALPEDRLPENHLWGSRDYYKSRYYSGSHCSFASEIGYHGCPSVSSLKKFISADSLWPWQNNDEWIIHCASPETDRNGPFAYRIDLMAKQIRELFGLIPDNIEDFSLASQISQAEALKYFIELFRSGKWNRSGIIWWNLIDGWPQISDAVVDYYFDRKLAYFYVKQSQQPLLLCFSEPENQTITLKAVNDTGRRLDFNYEVFDYANNGRKVIEGSDSAAEEVISLCGLPYSGDETKLYTIAWSCGEYSGKNHYLCGNPPFSLCKYKQFLAATS